jgi:hypothetical protein
VRPLLSIILFLLIFTEILAQQESKSNFEKIKEIFINSAKNKLDKYENDIDFQKKNYACVDKWDRERNIIVLRCDKKKNQYFSMYLNPLHNNQCCGWKRIKCESYENPDRLSKPYENKGLKEHFLYIDFNIIKLDYNKAKELLDNKRKQDRNVTNKDIRTNSQSDFEEDYNRALKYIIIEKYFDSQIDG